MSSFLRACGAWIASIGAAAAVLLIQPSPTGADDFVKSHTRSQYVHWIDLYDAAGRKIDPADENPTPYSTAVTCGKCHDVKAMAHGWHFNAVEKLVDKGRPGEPWVWTDRRTGTQIPLSYRGWEGTYDPRELNISQLDFVLKFGRHLPGGGPGIPPEAPKPEEATQPPAAADASADAESPQAQGLPALGSADPVGPEPQWKVSGQLAIDCMMCHSADRSYSPEVWREQVENRNFAWAASAAMGLAHVEGRAPSVRTAEDAAAVTPEQLPRTQYVTHRFNAQNKVFFDVQRTPTNNSCYYCHTTRPIGESAELKWQHDQDVHLRAGMKCADCHRNGIEHHTVRGFLGEEHPTGASIETLSCRGCHLGEAEDGTQLRGSELAKLYVGGRLGAPKPAHKGLPVLHLEKMSCTSCHSGPVPDGEARLIQTSMAHGLGKAEHWEEGLPPAVVQPVLMKVDFALRRDVKPTDAKREGEAPAEPAQTDGDAPADASADSPENANPSAADAPPAPAEARQEPRPPAKAQSPPAEQAGDDRGMIYPMRMIWPAFWGVVKDERIVPLNPEQVFSDLRTTLRIRSNFTEEIASPRLRSSEKEEILGPDRKDADAEDWTDEERLKVVLYTIGKGLKELADKHAGQTFVYVSGGKTWRLNKDGKVEQWTEPIAADAAAPYAWPIGHDVRPARYSLGSFGCYECHSDESPMFEGTFTAQGPLPDPQPAVAAMHDVQDFDLAVIQAWNQSFEGRPIFKWVGFVSAGIVALILVLFLFVFLNGLLRIFAPKGRSRTGEM